MLRRITIAAMMLSAACVPAAADDNSKNLAGIHKRASGALAVVRCKYAGDVGPRTITGLGICIQNSEGRSAIFITLMLDPKVPQDSFSAFELVVPGAAGKTMKAKLLGIDPETGVGFVRADGQHPWSIVQFAAESNTKTGQQVTSVGTLSANLGYPTCLSTGRVSAVLRVPGKLVYVSGGKLTGIGSPVFSMDGRAIGIVGHRQLFLSFETMTSRGMVPIALKGVQETSFFTPVEEFVEAIKRIPRPGQTRRLRWMGVLKFEGLSKQLAELAKLDRPAVKIGRLVPTGPAVKAGLLDGDLVVAIDDQPLERLATPDLTAENFVRKIHRMPAGKKVVLSILRNNAPVKVTVQLQPMPLTPNEAKRHFSMPLGMGLREKVPMDQHLDKGPTAKVQGLIVTRLQRDGAAHKNGVKIGDLVASINKQRVTTTAGVKDAITRALQGKRDVTISLLIHRGDRVTEIKIRMQR